MKRVLIMLGLVHVVALQGCPITITNDDMHDIIVVDELKATLIRTNKKGTVGLEGKTNFAIYKAQTKAKDCNTFTVAYQVTEKECPSKQEVDNNKKINSVKHSLFADRAKTDLAEQKQDLDRFVVEDVTVSKKRASK